MKGLQCVSVKKMRRPQDSFQAKKLNKCRLEPLISVGAEKRRPVYAAYCKGGRRLHVGLAVCFCTCDLSRYFGGKAHQSLAWGFIMQNLGKFKTKRTELKAQVGLKHCF